MFQYTPCRGHSLKLGALLGVVMLMNALPVWTQPDITKSPEIVVAPTPQPTTAAENGIASAQAAATIVWPKVQVELRDETGNLTTTVEVGQTLIGRIWLTQVGNQNGEQPVGVTMVCAGNTEAETDGFTFIGGDGLNQLHPFLALDGSTTTFQIVGQNH